MNIKKAQMIYCFMNDWKDNIVVKENVSFAYCCIMTTRITDYDVFTMYIQWREGFKKIQGDLS